ncbi:hypothetical protein [Vineibacter terrae]|uniref:hypothetical protein n=1 Tax=Vineibacter terrae TaxID=2586908 RepID=UPI002E31AA1B|nr:hypothetical protein [Vineibacter terrae]HEX2891096.1 hypothetical protein [Vineibacter terrae]
MKARPRLVPDILARRVILRGEPTIVMQDPSTGRHFRASIPLHHLISLLDGRRTVGEALALVDTAGGPEAEEILLRGLAGMAAAGLLRVPGLRRAIPAPPPGAALQGVLQRPIYMRVPIGNLAPVLPVAVPLLGWLYTRAGTAILFILIGMAAWAWAGEGPSIAAQFDRLATLGPELLLIGWLLFAATKMLHEIGHAVAAHRMGAAEGLDLRSFRWGVSFMFLTPAPYVNVTSAWLIASRWRRARVGLAGMQVDFLVAAIAALAWAEIGEGPIADRLFELVLLCGTSSLLFNANPLLRMDGYYVLSDLLAIPNLQPRAWAALRRVALWPIGLSERPHGASDAGYALYSAASWCWRWTIFVGVFWVAGGISWVLAAAFAAVIGMLFVALPLSRGLVGWMRLARTAPARAAVAPVVIAGIAATLLLLPVPVHVVAEGVVWDEGVRSIYAPADGLVRAAAAPGATVGPVVQLDNAELRRTLTQLEAEAEALAVQARRARAETPSKADSLAERQRAVATQMAAIQAEIASWTVELPVNGVWEPLRAQNLVSAWVRRDDPRPLGVIVAPAAIRLKLVLDQWDGPAVLAALAAAGDQPVPVRRRGEGAASFEAVVVQLPSQARDELPSPALSSTAGGPIAMRPDARGTMRPATRVFEVQMALSGTPPDPPLRHGARIEARIRLPDASLVDIAWRRLRQALQRHLNV